jgi:hypothetical protein
VRTVNIVTAKIKCPLPKYKCHFASQEVLTQTIKSTKSRKQILKRKYSDINPTTSTSSSNRDSSPEVLSDATTRFIQSMEFVDNFKKNKDSTGQKANGLGFVFGSRQKDEVV